MGARTSVLVRRNLARCDGRRPWEGAACQPSSRRRVAKPSLPTSWTRLAARRMSAVLCCAPPRRPPTPPSPWPARKFKGASQKLARRHGAQWSLPGGEGGEKLETQRGTHAVRPALSDLPKAQAAIRGGETAHQVPSSRSLGGPPLRLESRPLRGRRRRPRQEGKEGWAPPPSPPPPGSRWKRA